MTVGPRAVPSAWHNRVLVAMSQSQKPAHTLQIARDQVTPMSVDLNVATNSCRKYPDSSRLVCLDPAITWSMTRAATADAVYVNAGHWLIVTRPPPGTVRFPELPAAWLPSEPASNTW